MTEAAMVAGSSMRGKSSLIPAPSIEMVPVAALHSNAKNPRRHSHHQIKRLATLIDEIGFINPVIVDENFSILAGHGRLAAAKRLGLVEIPVLKFDHLSATQKRIYLLADNRIAEQAGWDRELLSIELSELTELLPVEGLDLSLTGFEIGEIDLLLADMAATPLAAEDTLPTVPTVSTTRRGDLWQLGKHRLMCGDSLKAADFSCLMDGSTAAAVFTDPPYNVRVRDIGGRGKVRHPEFAYASGEMTAPQYRDFLTQTLTNGIHVSRDGAVHFVCSDWRHIADLIAVGEELYSAMLNLAVWVKSNAGQGSLYRSQHELIAIFCVGDGQHRNNIELGRFGRNRSNVWNYAGQNTFAHGRMDALSSHPTVKPTNMVADAILDCTSRGEVVLDQFAGSGTILIAAERTGRTAHAMEYEPRYVDVAIKRWQTMTKLEAVLSGDGRTFDEIASVRDGEHLSVRTRGQCDAMRVSPEPRSRKTNHDKKEG
jgi:DNA modification methylase